MLPTHGRLAGNSLFVKRRVTMNKPMNARVVLRKTPAITIWPYLWLLSGLGCILFTLPHFLVGRFYPDVHRGMANNKTLPLCFANTTSDVESSRCFSGYGGNWYYLMIFSIAQMIMGAGATPLYSLAPAYLDENVDPKSSPMYLGVFFASAIVGPGLGFVAGGAMLSKWVDLKMVCSKLNF